MKSNPHYYVSTMTVNLSAGHKMPSLLLITNAVYIISVVYYKFAYRGTFARTLPTIIFVPITLYLSYSYGLIFHR